MPKYLDIDGLRTLWAQITNKIRSEVNSILNELPVADDNDAFKLLMEIGLYQSITDETGAILTDENGAILLI